MNADTKGGVVRLYVVRRVLDGMGLPRFRQLAHSGVLLRTEGGDLYLLEYMADSRAYLTPTNPQQIQDNGDHLVIKMTGRAENGLKEFIWTRQKRGVALDGNSTPDDLLLRMQALMNSGYSVLKQEQCHTAQERLRMALGVFSFKP
jgi:hypothetical protein